MHRLHGTMDMEGIGSEVKRVHSGEVPRRGRPGPVDIVRSHDSPKASGRVGGSLGENDQIRCKTSLKASALVWAP